VAAFAVFQVGKPEPINAQIGSPSDPICRLRVLPGEVVAAGRREYDVKAALLYRCLELVQWPSETAAPQQAPLTVGIFGKNQFGESLNWLAGKSIAGRKLVVKKLSRKANASRCQLVFISISETNRTSEILNSLAGLPILTVGESPGFTVQGGMINLLLEGKNIRFEVNEAAAEKARILIDPKLIKAAAPKAEPAQPQNSASGP
jgi:hypothetical protein